MLKGFEIKDSQRSQYVHQNDINGFFLKKNNFFLDFYNERGQEVQENYVNTFSEKNLYWGHWAI